jgi:hypothetical protein
MTLFVGGMLYGCLKNLDAEKDDRPDHGCRRTFDGVIYDEEGYDDCVDDYYMDQRDYWMD